MSRGFATLAFTPAVQALQEKHGSRAQYARMQAAAAAESADTAFDALGAEEAAFLQRADSFYLASVSETGWPYVQHRGGPAGFLRVLGPTQLGFADFRGNKQYVSAGNVQGNDRVALIVMDYAARRRFKLLGHLRFVSAAEADAALLDALSLPGYAGRVERLALIDVAAFDWNCPQHITQRFTLAQVEAAVAPLHARIAELEAQLGELQLREMSLRDRH